MIDGTLTIATDVELGQRLLPLLQELENRMVIRDESGHAAQIVKLRCFILCDFGRDRTLSASSDTKTRQMFDNEEGQAKAAAANKANGQRGLAS